MNEWLTNSFYLAALGASTAIGLVIFAFAYFGFVKIKKISEEHDSRIDRMHQYARDAHFIIHQLTKRVDALEEQQPNYPINDVRVVRFTQGE